MGALRGERDPTGSARAAASGIQVLARAALQRSGALFAAGVESLVNVGFSTRLVADPEAPIVVLSPHLDDAVLNCWTVLSGPEIVLAVNVFADAPPGGFVTEPDLLCGARDSSAHMHERRAEDAEALALAGRTPINLPFRDRQYRRIREPLSLRDVDEQLSHFVEAASVIYAPASIGSGHPDHRLVRDLALSAAVQGIGVRLYADVPYAVRFGWPHWVTGLPEDPRLVVDVHWQNLARGVPGVGSVRNARVVRLTDEQAARKLAAMRMYRTQFPALDAGPIGMLSNPLIHGFEVFWEVVAGT
jgi:LmbE family N-acetylglucosaminyl deacetylase